MKRFYKTVTTAPDITGTGTTDTTGTGHAEGWRVLLDGRAIKTVGGRAQVVPSRTLAEAMADEWRGQGEVIDPSAFVYRDMADYALDVVVPDRGSARSALLRFAETDTLCYRADPDEPLYRHQQTVWEPVLARIEARFGVSFRRVSGIIHRPQPAETLSRLAAHLAGLDDFQLAALRNLASLAASLSIGLLALETEGEAEALWTLANLEEDWQAELWGKDEEALALRAIRGANFLAAARFATLAQNRTAGEGAED